MLNSAETSDQIRLPISNQAPPPEEDSLQFWHPNRFGVKFAPKAFRAELKAMHPDLEATWHPVRERWLVWYRRPRISVGWLLLFVVEDSQQRFGKLDARIFAVCYEQSGFKWGSGKQYWARIEGEAQRDQEGRDTDREDLLDQIGADQWAHTKIQMSMCGHSSGSKFANHHAGD